MICSRIGLGVWWITRNIRASLFFLIIYGLFLNGLAAQSSAIRPRIKYVIRPSLDLKESSLEVVMTFQGSASGSSRVILPSAWAGQKYLYKNIFQMKALSESTEIRDTDKPHVKRIIHRPHETVSLIYKVKQGWTDEISGERYQKYHPNITQDYFHFVGMVFFLHPAFPPKGDVSFELVWADFSDNWNICNSFGANQLEQSFTTTINNFLHSVYVGGDYRIKKMLIHNQEVYLAMRGNEWSFADREFFDFARRIIMTEREFWHDHDFPYFLITLTPFGKNHKNFGGSGLYQSFDVFFYSDAELNPNFMRLFAHELFHSWNVRKLGRLKPPEPLLYWFSEGFTDYYTRLLLLRSGLITLKEYVDSYNNKIRKYFTSPVKNVPNQKIQEGYWSDEHIGRLPYQRGDVLAHRWNASIKKNTDNRFSLDDLMLRLFDSAKKGRQIITNHLLNETVKQFSGLNIMNDLEKYIETGDVIELNGDELGPCFEMILIDDQARKEEGVNLRIPQYTLKSGFSYNDKACLDWFFNRTESEQKSE